MPNARVVLAASFLPLAVMFSVSVLQAQYAVRGELVLRAREHQRALRRGEERPFKKLVFCNIGNPQSVGQTPITFPRQVHQRSRAVPTRVVSVGKVNPRAGWPCFRCWRCCSICLWLITLLPASCSLATSYLAPRQSPLRLQAAWGHTPPAKVGLAPRRQ